MPIIAPGRAETRQDHAPLEGRALEVLRAAQRAGELVHLTHIPGQAGRTTFWPETIRSEVTAALAARGITAPWTHQAEAAGLARAGRSVILATRAASGKSAGYLAAALSEILDGGTVLYVAPTKALAADQLKAVSDLGVPGVRATCYDGDATAAERAWAQSHANYLLTNPDMIHSGLLPNHTRWRGFFRRLRVVIIDECHGYRGVFGSHVAQVLRRLRRVAAHHAALGRRRSPSSSWRRRRSPTRPSAPGSSPAWTRSPVTDDGSPRAPLTFALWEPPLLHTYAEAGRAGPPRRRRRTCSPPWSRPRSRRSPSSGRGAARRPSRSPPATRSATELSGSVAAYRSGYLADDRRGLEAGLRARADHRHGRHHRARARHQHHRP